MYPAPDVSLKAKRFLLALIAATLSLFPSTGPARAAPEGPEASLGTGAIQTSVLVPADFEQLASFGWSVDVSGSTAIIGARGADPDLGQGPLEDAGAAYIFHLTETGWVEETRLVASDAASGDTFGVSVAIDGNTVVVGATGVDREKEENAGAAYVFARQEGGWKQKARLVAPSPVADDSFGAAVAIQGITIVVGADSKDYGPIVDAGAAFVFIERGGSWDRKATLLPDTPTLGGYFGAAVAIQGNRVAIGATEANLQGEPGTGSAYVFRGSGRTWTQEAVLSLDDGRRGDFFGNSVALFDNSLAVGAVFRDPDLGAGRITNAGSVSTFRLEDGDWKFEQELTAADSEPFAGFGRSVDLYGQLLAIGAEGKSQEGLSEAGTVYLYARNKAAWQPQTRVVAEVVAEDDNFGNAVALSGERMVVGSVGADINGQIGAGKAYAYKLIPVQLPDTGFAPGRVTHLRPQPPAKAYRILGQLWLEIPELDIEVDIVGVPQGGSGWDTSWLWNRAGYLEGTAFPTWEGNSAIAGHAVLPSGVPGPFARLPKLAWGDTIIVHGWGQRYIYEVRSIAQVTPDDVSILQHESYPWLTLITCQDFDPARGEYMRRTIVRAIQTGIEADP